MRGDWETRKASWFWSSLPALLLALWWLAAFLAGCTPAPAPQQPLEVTAGDLRAAWEANKLAAESRYGGRLLDVTGVVGGIGRDNLGKAYMIITDGGPYAVWGVQCMFDPRNEAPLTSLHKGQVVKVRGVCDGCYVHGGGVLHVLLGDCVLAGKSE